MRLIVKRNLAQQIAEEIHVAEADGLEVERVEITRAEMADLQRCPQGPNADDPLAKRSVVVKDGEFFIANVPVVLEGSVKGAVRVHG